MDWQILCLVVAIVLAIYWFSRPYTKPWLTVGETLRLAKAAPLRQRLAILTEEEIGNLNEWVTNDRGVSVRYWVTQKKEVLYEALDWRVNGFNNGYKIEFVQGEFLTAKTYSGRLICPGLSSYDKLAAEELLQMVRAFHQAFHQA